MQALETQLTECFLNAAKEAELQCGVRAEQACRDIKRYGGVAYIRKLAKAGAESESLCRLAECGRVKLSFEACAVRSEYAALFTDEEINACFASLCVYGYYG